MTKILPKTFIVALIPTLLLLGALAGFVEPGHWPPVEDKPHQGEALDAIAFKNGQNVFAQESLSHLIREPQNTWSNLAFIFGGAYLFVVGSSALSRFGGIPLIAVGIGSFLYHASISPSLRNLDAFGFTWLLLSASIFAIASFFPRLQEKLNANMVLFSIFTFLLAIASTVFRKTVIFGLTPLALNSVLGVSATILLGSLVILIFVHRHRETMLKTGAAMILFALAVVCQVGDHPGKWLCNPEFPIQAHALWHIFAAVAFVLTVRSLDHSKKSLVST